LGIFGTQGAVAARPPLTLPSPPALKGGEGSISTKTFAGSMGKPTFIEAASMSRRKEFKMKGNSKKLAVFVIIPVITMFSAAAIAGDDNHKWNKGIEGVYAATSVCTSISTDSPDFLTTLSVPQGHAPSNGNLSSQTIWTFRRDGTGTVHGTQASINPSGSANILELSWQIIHQITNDGTITTDFPPGTPGVGKYTAGPLALQGIWYTVDTLPQSGKVSEDHKTITLGTVTPVASTIKVYNSSNVLVNTLYGFTNCGRVLIRLDE